MRSRALPQLLIANLVVASLIATVPVSDAFFLCSVSYDLSGPQGEIWSNLTTARFRPTCTPTPPLTVWFQYNHIIAPGWGNIQSPTLDVVTPVHDGEWEIWMGDVNNAPAPLLDRAGQRELFRIDTVAPVVTLARWEQGNAIQHDGQWYATPGAVAVFAASDPLPPPLAPDIPQKSSGVWRMEVARNDSWTDGNAIAANASMAHNGSRSGSKTSPTISHSSTSR